MKQFKTMTNNFIKLGNSIIRKDIIARICFENSPVAIVAYAEDERVLGLIGTSKAEKDKDLQDLLQQLND